MKRSFLCIVAFAVCFGLWGETLQGNNEPRYGIGFTASYDVELNSATSETTVVIPLDIMFSMMITEDLELMPYFIWQVDMYSDGSAFNQDMYLTIGAGCGLHWYPFRGKNIRFGTGIDLSFEDEFVLEDTIAPTMDSYNSLTVNLDFPAIFDLSLE